MLIGVNGDDNRAKARTLVQQQNISWRSFWDGGATGAICQKWNVDGNGWPTVYVLDAEGVIRFKATVDEPPVEDAVQELLKELERQKD